MVKTRSQRPAAHLDTDVKPVAVDIPPLADKHTSGRTKNSVCKASRRGPINAVNPTCPTESSPTFAIFLNPGVPCGHRQLFNFRGAMVSRSSHVQKHESNKTLSGMSTAARLRFQWQTRDILPKSVLQRHSISDKRFSTDVSDHCPQTELGGVIGGSWRLHSCLSLHDAPLSLQHIRHLVVNWADATMTPRRLSRVRLGPSSPSRSLVVLWNMWPV